MHNQKTIRISITVIILLMTTLFTHPRVTFAENGIPQPTEQFYVNDFANIFNDEQEQEMLVRAESLAEKPEGVQVVTSIVTSLEGMNVEEYANNMYNFYAIGLESRGVLILLSTSDRQIRVEVGDGLSNYLTEMKTGEFIDNYAIDYLANNQFDLGIMNLQAHIVSDLDEHFNIVSEDSSRQSVTDDNSADNNEMQNVELDSRYNEKPGKFNWIVWFFNILAIVGLAYTGIGFYDSNKKRHKEKEAYESELQEKEMELRTLKNSNYSLFEDLRRYRNAYNNTSQQYSSAQRDASNMRLKYSRIEDDYKALEQSEALLREEMAQLSDRYARAKKLYPNLDEAIDKMIQNEKDNADREIAKELDRQFGDLERIVPSATTDISELESAIRRYNSLKKRQKKYVKTNMDRIESIYAEAQELKAKERAKAFNAKLVDECGSVSRGSEETLGRFQRLQSEFKYMDPRARRFVDSALIGSLNALIMDGTRERDERIAEERRRAEAHRRQEEEERRRKEQRRREEEERKHQEKRRLEEEDERRRREERRREEERRRNSWSSGSSSRGGFGGHSSGGGASRSF